MTNRGSSSLVNPSLLTACEFRKELPFAGYSVVKDPPARLRAAARQMRDLRRHACQIRGGEYRARTGDLLVANQALSQLS